MDEAARPDEAIVGTEINGFAALCPHCLAANAESDHFCWRCATPLTSHAATDPLGRVFAEGDTLRKAVGHPSGAIVVAGLWLLFAPTVLTSVGLLIDRMIQPLKPESVPDALLLIATVCMYGGMAGISSAILYRVTRNFVRLRRTNTVPRGFTVIPLEEDAPPPADRAD